MAKKYYFDNKYVEECIAKYKKTGNIKHRDDAIVEIGKIINAIINLYRYWRYEDRDVLENEGYLACLNSIERFDPEKFKHKSNLAFRYFSLVVKKHLAFITTKETKFKIRNTVTDNIIVYKEQEQKKNVQKDTHVELIDMLDNNKELIGFLNRCLFTGLKKKQRIINYLDRYVQLNQKFFDKKGFINYTKGYGVTQSYTRKVLKEIEQSKELYNIYINHMNTNSLVSV